MIDVLLATYNGEKYISELLDSLENQTYKEWRLIVSDDHSSDETIKKIEEYKKASGRNVEIHVNNPGLGSAKKNFFKLLDYAKSEYIMFCDQDDVWLESKIEKTLNKMKESETGNMPVMVHTDLCIVDKKLQIIDKSFFHYSKYNYNFSLNQQLVLNMNAGCTMMVNKYLCDLAKRKCNVDNVLMHDSWVTLIACVFGKNEFVDEPLIMYRQHGGNSIGAKNVSSFSYRLKKLFDVKNIRISNMAHIKEIKEFYNTFKDDIVNEEYRRILAGFSALENKSRTSYRIFSLKNKTLKCPVSRAFLQLLYAHK